jgi:hypothetical protein
MHLTDILTLCFSIVGLYGLIFHVRFLVPCYCVPSVSALLYDTQRLLTHAETLNAIPGASEIRMDLEMYGRYLCLQNVTSLTTGDTVS